MELAEKLDQKMAVYLLSMASLGDLRSINETIQQRTNGKLGWTTDVACIIP